MLRLKIPRCDVGYEGGKLEESKKLLENVKTQFTPPLVSFFLYNITCQPRLTRHHAARQVEEGL